MKPRKKSNFVTFIFSFVPGAAEMYMGFMKSGLSILFTFILPILVSGALYGMDYIIIVSGVIYVFAFFHARNIATAPDEDFGELTDKYIWEEFTVLKIQGITNNTVRKCTAAILILIGAGGLWEMFRINIIRLVGDNTIIRNIVNSVPRLVFSIFVIVIGLVLIKGKKKELISNGDNIDNSEDKSNV